MSAYDDQIRAELARLQAASGVQLPMYTNRAPTPPEPPRVTPTMPALEKLVQEEVTRQMKVVTPVPAQEPHPGEVIKAGLFQIMKMSLTPAEMEWVNEHIDLGAPGLAQFLESDDVKTIAQMAFETYVKFLENSTK